ncbi:hypothetical protein ACFL3H_07890 [Gemmatimonadota bacterium]
MLKRTITTVVACALLFQVYGCAVMKMIPLDEVEGEYLDTVKVTTVYGIEFHSDTDALSVVQSDTLYTQVNGQDEKIPMSTVRIFQTRKSSVVATFLALSFGLAGFTIVGVMLFWR